MAKATGNLPYAEARAKILAVLSKTPANRNELKAKAPYGNYTGLMKKLEEEGVVKPEKREEPLMVYTITAKGKKALK